MYLTNEYVEMILDNLASIVAIVFIMYNVIRGIVKGALSELIGLVSIVLVIAGTYFLTPYLLKYIGTLDAVNELNNITKQLVVIVIYIIMYLLLSMLAKYLVELFKKVNNIPVVGGMNKILGGLIGLIESLLVMWLIFFFLHYLAILPFFADIQKAIIETPWLKTIYDYNILGLVKYIK